MVGKNPTSPLVALDLGPGSLRRSYRPCHTHYSGLCDVELDGVHLIRSRRGRLDHVLLSGVDGRQRPVRDTSRRAISIRVEVSPVVQRVDQVQRPVYDHVGVPLDCSCPRLVVVYHVSIEGQG